MSRSNHGPTPIHHLANLAIRPAVTADLPLLPPIEVSAGAQFRDVGMPEIAEDQPPTPDFYLEVLEAGTLWVVEVGDTVCAYGAAAVLDDHVHLEQVSVHVDFARRGIGLAMISHMAQWAAANDYPRATLITFVDVPWNAPYYRRFGFKPIDANSMGPELAAAFAAEQLTDLRHWRRVCMEKRFN